MVDENLTSVVLSLSNDDDQLFLPSAQKEHIKITDISHLKESSKFYHESKELQNRIKDTAESLLYHWKHFSIAFPSSLTGICEDIENKKTTESVYQIKDLFIIPSFDELDEVATDSLGKPKLLNKTQLKSIKKNGEFEVESIHFPGQMHKWRLASWLQLGSVKTNEKFYKHLSKSLHLIIITAKHRISSDYFSLKHGLKSWKKGVFKLIDIIIGLPAMRVVDYKQKMLEEEQMFLTVELNVDKEEMGKLNKFIENLTEYMNLNDENRLKMEKFTIPYFYRTPDNLLIDLRLFDKELLVKLEDTLKNILLLASDGDRSWIVNLRKKLISKFKNEGLKDEDIINKVSESLFKEYINHVFDKIASNKFINELSPNLSKALIEHAKAILIMRDALKQVRQSANDHEKQYREQLMSKYLIKSKVYAWLQECVSNELEQFSKQNAFKAHEVAIENCKKNGLDQAAYFLNREMIFRKEREQVLIKELSKIKTPSREYSFYRKIWLPKHWIVEKNQTKKNSEIVHPVIFENTFYDGIKNPKDSDISYSLQTWKKYTNTSKHPFWRWSNFFLRTWVNLWNIIFYLGIVIPFFSGLSFSALFRIQPFYPDKEINPYTGHLHPKKSSKTLTFVSRIHAIWHNVVKSRANFENIPDKGLIGKALQRFFNRIWNYVFKGFFGTLFVIIIFPILCITVSLSCILLGLLTPVWYPIVSIIIHLLCTILYDWDYPNESASKLRRFFVIINIFVFRFFICGIVEPIVALLTAFVICPLTSLLVAFYSFTVKITRRIWDNLMFYAILKPRARVPSRDTFFARRFAGPGLASNYFYQITVEQGLAALEAHLEIEILDAYLSNVQNIINEPLNEYQTFFDQVLEPFSYGLDFIKGIVYKNLKDETDKYLNLYREGIQKRKNLLRKSVADSDLSKIRLKQDDLKVLLSKATEIVKTQYIKSILRYRNKSVNELFKEKSLDDENDWTIFTGILLEEIFGDGFLIPLEETDNFFHLDVNHLNLSKYSSMIANSELRDDLDFVMTRYNPKSGRILIPTPEETTEIFDPLSNYSLYYSDISNKVGSKLYIPTRLPLHPGLISFLVYNRDNPSKQKSILLSNVHELIISNQANNKK